MTTARKVRQVLGALFFGALIGATLMGIAIIRSPHSHASPQGPDLTGYTVAEAAYKVCAAIQSYPDVDYLNFIADDLLAMYPEDQEHQIMYFAMHTACPQFMPLALAAVQKRVQRGMSQSQGSVV